ncbi:MAG: LacI family DNA-binding transcriptional regulator [Saccharopolyspora sp.]|uniref:LacI family DNA-binding transcriptional regulator n=1 Tax=unclassified Saccharopolyspora TaxID=2646250 RepID=UPI0025D91B6C|nr:LacI family DNA-binding transcriptional regulator [Saccharopolyspora sp.]MBQ6641469.1 LacI family DNA-binding transcriptional regulator [Saccharopolyspora sp.]
MVSIKDVAERAGVSVATVSNALNRPDRVSVSTRSRVQSAIDELGYVRSESARQLRAGHSRMLALLVLDIGNPFFVDVARGVEAAAREQQLGVMLCDSAQDPAAEALYLSLFAEQRVRGVLVTPADEHGTSLDSLQRQGIPSVLVDRKISSERCCSVSVDDVAGGALAVRHLVDHGHRRIAYVSGPAHLSQCRDRHVGALQAFRDCDLDEDLLSTIEEPALDVASGRDAGSRLLGRPDRPSAVFCANDLLALGLLQALFAAGVRVPEDIALVGYDDIEFASAAAVPLTSVRQPAHRIGYKAAELLLADTAGAEQHVHQQVVYEPELVVRRSSLAKSAE